MKAPPRFDTKLIDGALEAFRGVVGKEWVFSTTEDLKLYDDAYTPLRGEETERHAGAAVAPASAEEVQALMRIANERRIPIYPISTGRNLGYGGSAPVLSGSVVLDLKRLNRILDIDEKSYTVLVEPGVSYFDLFRHLRKNKIPLCIDCPDPGWGSLIGNALDRGNGYTNAPYRDHWGSHCGMEVVLANGEVVRTGMGALPGAGSWQQFQYGYGPFVDGIFSQSNYGVVTKMGFWLMAEPECYLAGRIFVPRYRDIVPLVDTLANVMNSGDMTAMTRVESPLLFGGILGIGKPYDAELTSMLAKPAGASPAELEEYAVRKSIPYWSVPVRFYGPEELVEAQWENVREKFQQALPQASFEKSPLVNYPLSDEVIASYQDPAPLGIPRLEAFGMGARSPASPDGGNLGHYWLANIIPFSGEEVLRCVEVFEKAFREWGVRPLGLPAPQCYHTRTLMQIYGFPVLADRDANHRNIETFRKMIRLAADNGWGEYRTAPLFMDDCAGVYSYNDHALLRVHERLKDAHDPNGILSAGRYGVWPAHLRNASSATT